MSEAAPTANCWSGAWPDAVAFAFGLGLAWWQRWNTTDLVWSLWLSAIARRKANTLDAPMMTPYRNVFRMHFLIFFFAFAHFAKLENFLVYAVVYAAYFFPWRLLRPAAARS